MEVNKIMVGVNRVFFLGGGGESAGQGWEKRAFEVCDGSFTGKNK